MKKTICLLLWTLCFLTACGPRGGKTADAKRSVYYWRTTFALDSAERTFLTEHGVERLYLRLFDVVNTPEGPMPQGTLVFRDDVPEGLETVPVVFFDTEVFNAPQKDLAGRLAERVEQMMSQHGLEWGGMQVDFDWTARNQTNYFAFLKELGANLKGRGKGLSATVRLHQLAMAVPPVDYGALMVYNIGRYAEREEKNSILTVDNLRPYLPHLADYDLPLATALPIYAWNLAFQGKKFKAIARGADLADTTLYKRTREAKREEYVVVRYHTLDNGAVTDRGGLRLYPGDVIRHEECSGEMLKEVARLLKKERGNAAGEVILYHLDKENIKKYEYEDIENLFGSR